MRWALASFSCFSSRRSKLLETETSVARHVFSGRSHVFLLVPVIVGVRFGSSRPRTPVFTSILGSLCVRMP